MSSKRVRMQNDIHEYIAKLSPEDQQIARVLLDQFNKQLPDATAKVWHAHPVWFINENPIVGFHRLKDYMRVLFWSGQSFPTIGLKPEGKFKAAEARFSNVEDVDMDQMTLWLTESREIQWDYKNIVKNKGVLNRL